ncbi:MAG: zinc ribbon domain-containing protein [Ruminococcus sp.]
MFCEHCGNQLEDNDKFCKKCGTPVDAQAVDSQPAQQQATPVQPVDYQPASQQAQPTASPYAVNPEKPAGDSPFVKALKNIPVAVKNYFIDSKAVISTAKKDKDVILASLFTAVLFLASLISGCLVFYGNGTIRYFEVSFGLVLLNSIMVVLASGVFYILVRFCSIKLFKKETDVKKSIIDSFIDFSFHSIPVAMAYIAGGIFGTFALGLDLAFILFATLYYIFVLVAGIKEEVDSPKNTSLFNLIVTLFITIALALVFYIIFQVLGSMVMGAVQSFTSNLFGGLGSYSSLFS